jgi:hypothetical protein
VVPLAPLTVGLALLAITAAGAQINADADGLLVRVGERVAEFYARAKNVICIERSTVQGIDLNNALVGFGRTVESELHVETEADRTPGDEAVFVRKVRKVNGRPPREKDKKDREGCTDPNPLTSEPLAFLLPAHRSEYQFRHAGFGRDRDQTALLIDFASIDRQSRPQLIEDPDGRDDCFDWSGHIASRGRIWVDAGTYDVLRVDRGLFGPVDVKVPVLLHRRYHLDNWVVIVRDDVTIRYQLVKFSDPDEVLLLPESIASFTVIRGGLQSTRRSQTFSDYRRFVTGGRVVESNISP